MTTAALPDFATTVAEPATEALPEQAAAIRYDWTREEIQALFERPFMDLLFTAQSVHRRYFDPNAVQVSTLLSIKTGANSIFCGERLLTTPNPASNVDRALFCAIIPTNVNAEHIASPPAPRDSRRSGA